MRKNRYQIKDKRMLTLINSCVKDMKSWGFKLPVPINWYSANCSKRLGQAVYLDNSITLSSFLFKESEDDNIRNTIYHELCHLVAGPGTHHGPKWKAVAKIVTEKTGLKIARLAESDKYDYFHSKEFLGKYKYNFKCKKCGIEVHYQKRTKFVNTYSDTYLDNQGNKKPRWVCSCCGGTFEKIK